MNNTIKRAISILIISSFLICSWYVTEPFVIAGETSESSGDDSNVSSSSNINLKSADISNSYYYVSKEYKGKEYRGKAIEHQLATLITDTSLIAADNKGYETDTVLLDEGDKITFTIDVLEEGLYYFNFDYYTLTDSMLKAELSMTVNGIYPYNELKSFFFTDNFVADYSELSYDRYGNEIVKKTEKYHGWLSTYIMDASYRNADPLGVYLQKGKNEITITNYERALLLGKLVLEGWQDLTPYTDPITANGDQIIIIEAEQPTSKNDSSIRAKGEYNMDITPYKDDKIVLNMIDGLSFKEGGQRINYKFEIKEAGYYYIGFNYRQSAKKNSAVFRDVYIDNVLLCKEMQSVPFMHSDVFKLKTIEDKEGSQIAVYFDKGVHEISIVVTLREVTESILKFERIIKEINQLALQVKKLTGGGEKDSDKDKYRDFMVEEYIPDIKERLLNWADEINQEYDRLCQLMGKKKISEFSSLLTAEKNLRELAKKPDKIPANIEVLNDDTSSARGMLATALNNIYYADLDLDKILIYQENADLGTVPGFFARLLSAVRRFFLSFLADDYSKASDNDDNVLQIWVNRSRQYVEIMQKMADEYFTPQTGITVKLSIMPDQNKLVLAKAAGTEPDIAASIGMGSVYDLAVRGALWNLREADGFAEVAGRFTPALFVPSVVEDGIYAIPETFDFLVTYFRTDIMEAYKLKVPDTWEDVYEMLPVLQRNGMNFVSYLSQFIVGIKPLSSTLPFIYQYGGEVFGNNILDIQLDSEEALKGMDEAVKLFTVYNVPFEVASFFQHFRDGSLPIGISTAGTYVQLSFAAPEIKDSWDISLYPGVYDEKSGEVVRSVNGAGEGLVVFESSNKKEEAFEYIKWWTSKEIQLDFAYSLQASYGKEYFYMTANIEAFMELPIKREHKEVILEMMSHIKETQKIPGAYMIERQLSDSFNSIILKGKNARSIITEALTIMKREIIKKSEEFGYIKDGEIIKEYPVVTEEILHEWLRGK